MKLGAWLKWGNFNKEEQIKVQRNFSKRWPRKFLQWNVLQRLQKFIRNILKNVFGFSILLFSFQCCWQVLQTSTDPSQQFSAPFKAGNSRQVQTCYKPQKYFTKETATFSSSYRYRRNRSSHDLEPQSINALTLAACASNCFHFDVG